jgi:hypothetical protein
VSQRINILCIMFKIIAFFFIYITGFVTRVTRRVALVEQELPTLSDHLSSSPVISGFRVTRSLVLCVNEESTGKLTIVLLLCHLRWSCILSNI